MPGSWKVRRTVCKIERRSVMARKEIKLKKVPKSQLKMFKIKNRKGFAAICKDNLTEGRTRNQAIDRMDKALKRTGYTLG
jgi:hypothetical protein